MSDITEVVEANLKNNFENMAKPIEGCYEDSDISILRGALLEKYQFKIGKHGLVFSVNAPLDFSTYLLSSVGLGGEQNLAQLKETICIALLNKNKNKQILFPYMISGHWVTVQILIVGQNAIQVAVYDSAQLYKSGEIEENLGKFLGDSKVFVEFISNEKERIKEILENKGTLINIFFDDKNNKKIIFTCLGSCEIFRIQLNEKGFIKNEYCGGYSARLMVKLTQKFDHTISNQQDWGCAYYNEDSYLRFEDAKKVTKYNSSKIADFGKKNSTMVEGLAYTMMQENQEKEQKQLIATEDAFSKITEAFEKIDDDIIKDMFKKILDSKLNLEEGGNIKEILVKINDKRFSENNPLSFFFKNQPKEINEKSELNTGLLLVTLWKKFVSFLSDKIEDFGKSKKENINSLLAHCQGSNLEEEIISKQKNYQLPYQNIKVFIDGQEIELKNLKEVNIILGRNGCGKSRLLRSVVDTVKRGLGSAHYIYPERGIRVGFSGKNEIHSADLNESIFFRETMLRELKFFARKMIGSGEFLYFQEYYLTPINDALDNIYLRVVRVPVAKKEYEKILICNKGRVPDKQQRSKTEIFLEKSVGSTAIVHYFDGKQWCNSEDLDISEVKVNWDAKICTEDEDIQKIIYWFGIREVKVKYFKRKGDIELLPEDLSSGENEIISLWMDIFRYLRSEGPAKNGKILLIDEPDVHLHPDAQYKIAELIFNMVHKFNQAIGRASEDKFQVILVTHSTSILGALSENRDAAVCFMKKDSNLDFTPLGDGGGIKSKQTILKSILPVFGTHPLTQAFNETPILLVEGADEDWIWQQAIRSSKRKLKIYPCSVDSVYNMPVYEEMVGVIVDSIYDKPKAYSLRDRDNSAESDLTVKINGNLKGFTLNCRNSESLLLSDEVLNRYKITYQELIYSMNDWIVNAQGLRKKSKFLKETLCKMEEFKNSNYDRKVFDVKMIVDHLLCLIREISKRNVTDPKLTEPWQRAVGSVIGQLVLSEDKNVLPVLSGNSIIEYLGIELGIEFYPHLISLWFKIRKIIRNILSDDQIDLGNGDVFCGKITSLLKDKQNLDIKKSVHGAIEVAIFEIPGDFAWLIKLFREAQQNLENEIFRLIELERKKELSTIIAISGKSLSLSAAPTTSATVAIVSGNTGKTRSRLDSNILSSLPSKALPPAKSFLGRLSSTTSTAVSKTPVPSAAAKTTTPTTNTTCFDVTHTSCVQVSFASASTPVQTLPFVPAIAPMYNTSIAVASSTFPLKTRVVDNLAIEALRKEKEIREMQKRATVPVKKAENEKGKIAKPVTVVTAKNIGKK